MLQYIPRQGSSDGPLIAQGSYTKHGKVISVNFESSAVYNGAIKHPDSGYDLPSECKYSWTGKTIDGKSFRAYTTTYFDTPSSITDVLSIFPKFFKDIVSIWAGLPYVFCYRVPNITAYIEIDGETSTLEGMSNTEITMVHNS